MGYVVLPALVADISDVYDVYFAAFKNNAITRALFPSATTEDLTNAESEFRYDPIGTLSWNRAIRFLAVSWKDHVTDNGTVRLIPRIRCITGKQPVRNIH